MDPVSETSLPQTLSSLVSSSSSTTSPQTTEPNFVNGVNDGGATSDSDGFVSGEDDTEPTRPVLVSPSANSAGAKSAVVDPSDDDEETLRPVAKVSADDEDDDDEEEDEEEPRSEVSENEKFGEAVGEGYVSDVPEEVFVEADDKGFESGGEGVEVVREVGGEGGGGDGGTGNLDSVVEDSRNDDDDDGDKAESGDGGGDSLVDTLQVNVLGSGGVAVVGDDVQVEESEIKGVEAPTGVSLDNGFDPIEKGVVDEVAAGGGETGNSDSVIAEPGNDDDDDDDKVESGGGGVENGDGGVVLTSGGDSLVDTLQVNVLGSGGVAVVGDEVEVEESEIKGVEAPSGVSLDNVFDPIEKGVVDEVSVGDAEPNQTVDTGIVVDEIAVGDAEPNQTIDTGVVVDDDDDDGHVQKNDTDPPLEEGGGSEPVIQVLKGEQDGVNLEGDDVVEEESGSRVEASGEGDEEDYHHVEREIDGSVSDGKGEGMFFGGSEDADEDMEELEQVLRAGESSRDERIDGQIVTDSDEEADTDDEGDRKELFDTATLAALLKAASGAGHDGGNITITSQDGSRLFSVERPAGLGQSLQSGKPAIRSNRPNLFSNSISRAGNNSDINLSEEEKKKLENLQQLRIKFLRLVHRLGFTTEDSMAAQVLYRLTLVAGRQTGQFFSLDAAKEKAFELEAEGRDDFNFSINILVLGKTGVGKSATINSIFGETKTSFSAYGPATTAVTEIVGVVDGVQIRIFDTPGLRSSAFEQNFNRKVLTTVKKLTKKSPPDIVLYVDRMDLQTRDLNDLPLLRTITSTLGPSIWRNVIVTLTHGASAPPDGPSGSPLSYDVFVAQRSHIVQQTIGQAVGDVRLMNPSLMNPVSLVENHPNCRKNRDGQKVLPNGQSWRPILLLLCYSMKILSEAGNLSKAQESFDQRRLFGFRTRSPPLPYLLSWLLQSRQHPKLPADQGGIDNGDSDVEMADLSDSDLDEDEDEYDQLPPFKPLKKSQIANLNKEQKKAYLEEYDYRVKLLQKKQWREELKRMKEMKKKGKTDVSDYGYPEEDDPENGSPAAVPVPLPDMVLPPSFDSENPAYRYRFLEPTSQLLTRPVLDSHSWDHDCGYDGVNIEQTLAIINKFPGAVTVQVTKDKKDFSLHLDSSIAAKHGDNASTMAGFDIQNIGKQLAYIVRGETKFKNFKRNKTGAGFSVTFLGENVSTGLKAEDQIALGKRLVLVGSAGTVRSQGDSAYGANLEVRLREADFPIGQDQSSLSLSLVKWRGDLALGANLQSQFSLGRSYKVAVRAGLNNKCSGQISVRTSSSEQVQIALLAILPVARAIYKNFWPGASENYSIY
ncbi:translocase of chloroplast 159, chloroplastic [Lotus japonicus]|uniref:translocase of chloroplast 159, chloroplastic n=1 Tax=Lotus japonicus TaxID=34305 RepID=UPI002588C5D9|nr:translocase of chloroplast 159, chloroplastic [Lotus japonicus]